MNTEMQEIQKKISSLEAKVSDMFEKHTFEKEEIKKCIESLKEDLTAASKGLDHMSSNLSISLINGAQQLVYEYMARGEAKVINPDVFRINKNRSRNFQISFIISSDLSGYFLRVFATMNPNRIDPDNYSPRKYYITAVYMDFISYENNVSSDDLLSLLPSEETRFNLCMKVRKEILTLMNGTLSSRVLNLINSY